MNLRLSDHPVLLLQKSSTALAVIVVFFGSISYVGWWQELPIFISPISTFGPMSPLAAVFFIMTGVAILLSGQSNVSGKFISGLLMAVMFTLSAAELSEMFHPVDFSFDTYLFREKLSYDVRGHHYQVNMAFNTSLNFSLLAIAALLNLSRRTLLRNISNYVSLSAALIALCALLGHLFEVEPLKGLEGYTLMSLYTALLFLPISLSLLFRNAEVGFMSTFSSHRAGGTFASIFIPTAVILILVMGVVRLKLETAYGFSKEQGMAMLVAGNIVLFIYLLHFLAKIVNRKEELREKAEEELEKANRVYNTILESGMAGYWDWQMDKQFFYTSPTFREMFGYENEEFTEEKIRTLLLYPDDVEQVQKSFEEHVRSRGHVPFHNEIRCYHKNGSILWIISRGKVIEWDATGAPIRMVGSHVNITPIKEAQQRAEESEKLFSQLFQTTPVTLAITRSEDGTLIDANSQFSELFGYDKDNSLSKTTIELGLFPDPRVRDEILQEIGTNGRIVNKEVLFKLKSGELRYTSYNAFQFDLFGERCLLSAILDIDELKKTQAQLRENERLFSTLFYKSPLLLTIYDASTATVIDVSDSVVEFYGATKDQLIGKTDFGITAFKDPGDTERLSFLLQQHSCVRGFEFTAIDHEGNERTLAADVDIIHQSGKSTLLLVTGRDVTENRTQEQQIHDLNATLEKRILERTREITDYKTALDESAIIAITDEKGVIRHVNENFCSLSKYDASELIGQTHSIVNSGYHPKEFFTDLWRTISRGEIWQGEIKNKAKDGSFYWVYTTIVPFVNENNRPYQFLAIRFDITSSKNAKAELQKSNNELQSILQNADTAFILFDSGLNIRKFNNLAAVFTKERLAKNLEADTYAIDYFPEARKEAMRTFMNAAMSGANPAYEISYPLDDGTTAWYYTRLAGIPNQNGGFQGVIMQVSDITERKRLEQQKEKITLDLVRQNQDLEKFAFIVSHNLRSPLSTIMGLASLLKVTSPEDPDFGFMRDGMEVSAQNLDIVVRDLNQILQTKREINDAKERVDLLHLSHEVMTNLRDTIHKQYAEINLHFSESEVFSKKEYIYNIFYNLISNSLKFHRQNVPPVIGIGARKENGKIIITFQDNGRGIDLQRYGTQVFGLYKKFHPDVDGKGMGLFMVKTQVEALGGKIELTSEVDKGTQVLIEFDGSVFTNEARIPMPLPFGASGINDSPPGTLRLA